MQGPIKHLVLVLLSALFLSSTLLAQNNKEAQKPDVDQALGNSLVNGRAVYEDTGLPASRHRIQLVSSQLLVGPLARFPIPTAITNENGEFSLRRVAAGEYYVVPKAVDARFSTPGFPFIDRTGDRAADTAQVEQFKKDYTRIVVDGQRNLTINLRVANSHLGSISGRVLDSTGMPAVRASVHLMSKGEKYFGASLLSDEQGQYKVLGLPAGEYIVSASPPVNSPPPADGERRPNYDVGVLGATFFPSTLESRNSPRVAVFPDRDTGNIDITLLARSLHSLAGMIVYRGSNQAVSNAGVRLTRDDPVSDQRLAASNKPDIEGAMSNYISSVDKSGHWLIANVPDGNYRLRVESPSAVDATTQRFVAAERNVKVEGSDVADLLIEVSTGASVSGVVTIEGDRTELQFIDVHASRFEGNATSHIRLTEPDKFTLIAVPTGEFQLSAFAAPQDKFYVKSIEANGMDFLRTNPNIAEGEEIKDVRIVVSSHIAVVSGRVISGQDSKPIKGLNVMLRRVSGDKLRLFGGKLATTTDENGKYLVSAAPGVYLVVAWRASDGPGAYAAAMDQASREQGSGLTLSPNDRKQLDIRVP
jgi:Carboxypeptidase regulatory-like domain